MTRVFWAPPIRSVSVGQLANNQLIYTERIVRLEGWLVPGSLLRSATCVCGFRLESDGVTIPVHFAQCLPSHIFHHEPHGPDLPKLKLSERLLTTTYWVALFGTYANVLATFLAAASAAGRMQPIAAQGHTGAATHEALISVLLVSLSVAMIAVCVRLASGLRGASDESPSRAEGTSYPR